MKGLRSKIISPILLLFLVQSVHALQSDSLQNVLKRNLNSDSFDQKEDVTEYINVITQLYSESPSSALFYLNELENKLQAESNNTGRAEILSKKGAFYWGQGIYDKSLKASFKALSLYEESQDSLNIVKTLNNIGEIYKKQKDYSQSTKFIKLALSKANQMQGVSPQLILVNLGQVFMLKENYDSANFYLNQIIHQDSASLRSKAFGFLYKGIINRKTNQRDSAIYFLQKSLPYWQDIGYDRGIVENHVEIAAICIDENDFEKARQHVKQAESLAVQINSLDLLLRIYQSKIDLIKHKGSKDSLVYYFDKYLQIKDSIFNSESQSEINKLSMEYNFAQKEKESYKLALEQAQLARTVEQRTQFLIVLIGILILTIAIIIYLRNKSNQLKSAHIKLKQQKEEIEQKQKSITSKSEELAKVNNELYNLNTHLENRVVEGTKKLNERNRQIAEFTFYNSHRLRAPVAHVLGLINIMELSKDGKIDPQIIEYLKMSALELDKVIFNLTNLLDLEEETDSKSS